MARDKGTALPLHKRNEAKDGDVSHHREDLLVLADLFIRPIGESVFVWFSHGSDQETRSAFQKIVPPAGLEPTHLAPEASALST